MSSKLTAVCKSNELGLLLLPEFEERGGQTFDVYRVRCTPILRRGPAQPYDCAFVVASRLFEIAAGSPYIEGLYIRSVGECHVFWRDVDACAAGLEAFERYARRMLRGWFRRGLRWVFHHFGRPSWNDSPVPRVRVKKHTLMECMCASVATGQGKTYRVEPADFKEWRSGFDAVPLKRSRQLASFGS